MRPGLSESLVTVLKADTPAPVTLSAPHDGILGINDFGHPLIERTCGNKRRDLNTGKIAAGIFENIASSGLPVGLVTGNIQRRFVDFNRPPQDALEDPILLAPYYYYHKSIRGMAQSSRLKYGKEGSIVLEFHGFERETLYDVVLGTRNRSTIRHGNPDIKLAYLLRSKGYRVFVPEKKPIHPTGNDRFRGGYTTTSISRLFDMTTIQIEIAPWLRCGNETETRKLSSVIGEFLLDSYHT